MRPRLDRISILLGVAVALATPSAAAGQSVAPAAPTASPPRPAIAGTPEAVDLLERVRTALGGVAVDRVPGVRASMRVRRGERDESPVVVTVASRPAQGSTPFAAVIRQSGGGRSDSEIGFDGAKGWMSDGTGGFMPLDADQARSMLAGADLQALVREIAVRFDRVDPDPTTEFRGRRVLALRATRDDDPPGAFTRIHIDPSTALPIAIESFEATVDSAEPRLFSTAIFDRWERLGAVRVFRKMTSERGGADTIVEFDSIAYDAVPDEVFVSPIDLEATAAPDTP